MRSRRVPQLPHGHWPASLGLTVERRTDRADDSRHHGERLPPDSGDPHSGLRRRTSTRSRRVPQLGHGLWPAGFGINRDLRKLPGRAGATRRRRGPPCGGRAGSSAATNGGWPPCSARRAAAAAYCAGAARGDGEDHAGHGVDRLGVGQVLVEAQGVPGPERDGVADDGAQPAVLVVGAAERCGEDVAEEGVLVAQGLLVLLGQGGKVTVEAGQHVGAGPEEPVQVGQAGPMLPCSSAMASTMRWRVWSTCSARRRIRYGARGHGLDRVGGNTRAMVDGWAEHR
jgi:hypothetical protein